MKKPKIIINFSCEISILIRNIDFARSVGGSAPARAYICFQNTPLIFSKLFHNHLGPRGCRQYHVDSYFVHKCYKKAKNPLFYAKLPLSSETSIWRALSAPSRACICFQNTSLIFSNLFHNHLGSRGRRQYHFGTYFCHKGCEKTKNRHFHAKFPLSPKISIWRAVSAPVRAYNYFEKQPHIFSKLFHNHLGPRGRRQYYFDTYFCHKSYEKVKNIYFYAKFPLSPEMSIWCAVPAPAWAYNYFENLPLIISKLFHNHTGSRGRRPYHLLTKNLVFERQ